MLPFRHRLTLPQRICEFDRVAFRRSTHVPCIVERGTRGEPVIPKEKFLVPHDLTVPQFAYAVRKQLTLTSSDALFLMIGGTIPSFHTAMEHLYQMHRSDDGFLYVTYVIENTFG